MNHRHSTLTPRARSNGFVLVLALIFLALLTLLTLAASQNAFLQQRMATAMRDAVSARMSAASALRAAEFSLWVRGKPPLCTAEQPSADGCMVHRVPSAAYEANGLYARFRTHSGWLSGLGVADRRYGDQALSDQAGAARFAHAPRYLIEDLGTLRAPGTGQLHESGNTGPDQAQAEWSLHIYRITARGVGAREHGVSIMQSTFNAPAPD